MHRSRINGILIDCNVEDIDAAARFWAEALGRPIEPDHPGTRDDYVMLETPPGEIAVQVQRVEHESRVHLDIETDDIPAEVARLEKLGGDGRQEAGTMGGNAGAQRSAVLRRSRSVRGVRGKGEQLELVRNIAGEGRAKWACLTM